MTREEAIKIIRREYSCVDRDCDIERSCGKCPYSMPSKEPILKAYCLAVEALELVTSYEGTINKLTEALNQQKEGHNCNEDYADCDQFVCSECCIELQDWHRVERDKDDGDISYHEYVFRFCPNCGAHMKGGE